MKVKNIIAALLPEGFFNFVSLEKKTRYTLGREDRLKSRKTIEQLFKEGRSFSVYPFRVLYILIKDQSSPYPKPIRSAVLPGRAADLIGFSQPPLSNKNLSSTGAGLQAGFTVNSRHFKKAVDRNRVKRLMREAYRLQKNELQLLPELNKNALKLFIIYIGKELPEFERVYEKTAVVLKRLIKLTVENR